MNVISHQRLRTFPKARLLVTRMVQNSLVGDSFTLQLGSSVRRVNMQAAGRRHVIEGMGSLLQLASLPKEKKAILRP